jgi:hypothetical protein
MRAGKVVGKELGQNLLDRWARGMSGQDKSVIVSRHPLDIIRMSDHDNWSSCHAPPHKNRTGYNAWQSAINEAEDGGLIAYLIDSKDLKDINLQSDEIFEDDERGIDGISPNGRVRLNRYTSSNYDLAIPVTKAYGQNSDGFLESVRDWAYESQKNMFENDEVDYDYMYNFTRRGGAYADIPNDSELFNHFFDTEVFSGSVSFEGESGDTQYEIWQEEVSSIDQKFASKLKYTSFGTDISQDGENLYLYGWASINFEFKDFINENIDERLRLYLGYNSKWKDLVRGGDFVIGDVDATPYGDSLSVTFTVEGLEMHNPDGYREAIEEFIDFEVEKYHNLKYKIALDLERIGVLEPIIPKRKSILESLDFKNVFIEDEYEQDDLDDELHLITMECPIIRLPAMPQNFHNLKEFAPVKEAVESKIKSFTNYDLQIIYMCNIKSSSIRILSKFPIYSDYEEFEEDILEWKKIDNVFPQLSNEISKVFYEESISILYNEDFWFNQISNDPKNISSIPEDIYKRPEFKKELEEKVFGIFNGHTINHFYNHPGRFFNDETVKYPEYLRAFSKWVQMESQKSENLVPLRRLLSDIVRKWPDVYSYLSNFPSDEERITQGLDEILSKDHPQIYNSACNVLDNIINRETYNLYYQKIKDKFLSSLNQEITSKNYFPDALLGDKEVLNAVIEYLLSSGSHEDLYKIYIDISLPHQVQWFAKNLHDDKLRMQHQKEANGNWYKLHKKSLINH